MSLISKLKVDEKVVEVNFPGIDDFIIKLAYLSRDRLTKIRQQSLTRKLNKRTRQYEEEIDMEKFTKIYTKEAIRNWSGLKIKHLPELLLVDITGHNPEEEIPYSEEEALDLVKNSTTFDTFITESMSDITNFEEEKREEEEKNFEATSKEI